MKPGSGFPGETRGSPLSGRRPGTEGGEDMRAAGCLWDAEDSVEELATLTRREWEALVSGEDPDPEEPEGGADFGKAV